MERFDQTWPGVLSKEDLFFWAYRSYEGLCRFRMGRYEEAERAFQAAYSGFRDVLGEDHIRTTHVVRSLMELYETWGKPEKAAEYRALLQ